MKKGKYATYNAAEYEVTSQQNGMVVLKSYEAESLLEGFYRVKQFISTDFFIKEVALDDIDRLYHIDTHARYEGELYAVYYDDIKKGYRLETDDSLAAYLHKFEMVGPNHYRKYVQPHEIELVEQYEKLR
ncbi:hypothetical protein [Kurthia massiliensis]|uniref:hypothetical protein n=1 Tax=Kurthia massiliensis TaxID=1033739 RepID=UPI0002898AD4|nr:hypothetical protein [Kurthia massiliensis]